MSDPVFRIATLRDLPAVDGLFRAAIDQLRSVGIDQWDHVYPARSDFADDIALALGATGVFTILSHLP